MSTTNSIEGDERITCQICNARIMSVKKHIEQIHPEYSLDDYKTDFPSAPLLSSVAEAMIQERIKQKADTMRTNMTENAASKVEEVQVLPGNKVKEAFHKIFGLGTIKAAMNGRGEAIPVSVCQTGQEFDDMIPDRDPNYVFPVDILKSTIMGIEINKPVYIWGHAGTGKSTLIEQIASCMNWPMRRIQHTANMEESDVLGKVLINEKGTYFEPGELAMAMKHGWIYLADEYDYSHPQILGVYQAVLEGKPLVIKEAPKEWRVVHPHPNFRFIATGNTNGSGDEYGFYSGTVMGNAANYSRFAICEQLNYMSKNLESQIIQKQAGIIKEDADKLIDFARIIRESFEAQKFGATIGPRELIHCAMIGLFRGSWDIGIRLSYINRLNSLDRETALGIVQRVMGSDDVGSADDSDLYE